MLLGRLRLVRTFFEQKEKGVFHEHPLENTEKVDKSEKGTVGFEIQGGYGALRQPDHSSQNEEKQKGKNRGQQEGAVPKGFQ